MVQKVKKNPPYRRRGKEGEKEREREREREREKEKRDEAEEVRHPFGVSLMACYVRVHGGSASVSAHIQCGRLHPICGPGCPLAW